MDTTCLLKKPIVNINRGRSAIPLDITTKSYQWEIPKMAGNEVTVRKAN